MPQIPVKPCCEKYFCFSEARIRRMVRPSHPVRGADRESSRTRCGMRWTRACVGAQGNREARSRWDSFSEEAARDERREMRTAKSCGPGAPMQAPSWRRCFSSAPMTVAIKLVHRGEYEVSRKTIRAGKAGSLGCTCGQRPAHFFRAGAAGASRHPAFPAPSPIDEGTKCRKTSGARRRGTRAFVLSAV
jgi:hypothetical protein